MRRIRKEYEEHMRKFEKNMKSYRALCAPLHQSSPRDLHILPHLLKPAIQGQNADKWKTQQVEIYFVSFD